MEGLQPPTCWLQIEFGSTSAAKKPAFQLDQRRRATELGVGVASAQAVELLGLDEAGREAPVRVRAVVREG